jgi:hypothetical protein
MLKGEGVEVVLVADSAGARRGKLTLQQKKTNCLPRQSGTISVASVLPGADSRSLIDGAIPL